MKTHLINFFFQRLFGLSYINWINEKKLLNFVNNETSMINFLKG